MNHTDIPTMQTSTLRELASKIHQEIMQRDFVPLAEMVADIVVARLTEADKLDRRLPETSVIAEVVSPFPPFIPEAVEAVEAVKPKKKRKKKVKPIEEIEKEVEVIAEAEMDAVFDLLPTNPVAPAVVEVKDKRVKISTKKYTKQNIFDIATEVINEAGISYVEREFKPYGIDKLSNLDEAHYPAVGKSLEDLLLQIRGE